MISSPPTASQCAFHRVRFRRARGRPGALAGIAATLWMGLAVCSPGTTSAKKGFLAAPAGQPTERVLDLDALGSALAQHTQPVALSADDLPGPPADYVFDQPAGVKLPDSRGLLVQTLRCKGRLCTPRVGLLVPQAGGALAPKARLDLPALPETTSGLSYDSPVIVKLFGEEPESLLIRYSVRGPERPALGPKSTQYLAILNLPDLSLALHTRLAESGRRGVEPACTAQVALLGCSGTPQCSLRIQTTCDCPAGIRCQAVDEQEFKAAPDHHFRSQGTPQGHTSSAPKT